jgi:hypothetical protein
MEKCVIIAFSKQAQIFQVIKNDINLGIKFAEALQFWKYVLGF